MSVKESKILLKKETVTVKEANVTIQKLLDTFTTAMGKCLDEYYIYIEQPSLQVDNYDNEVSIRLEESRSSIDDITSDVEEIFEELMDKLIEDENSEPEEPEEEGENGQL